MNNSNWFGCTISQRRLVHFAFDIFSGNVTLFVSQLVSNDYRHFSIRYLANGDRQLVLASLSVDTFRVAANGSITTEDTTFCGGLSSSAVVFGDTALLVSSNRGCLLQLDNFTEQNVTVPSHFCYENIGWSFEPNLFLFSLFLTFSFLFFFFFLFWVSV
jgi:hypothetical protein